MKNRGLLIVGLLATFIILAGGIYLVLDAVDNDPDTTDNPDVVIQPEATAASTTTDNELDMQSDGKTIIDPPRKVNDFSFPASTGDTIGLTDLEGQYVLVAFGYTRCPDVCPATMLEFRQIKRSLGTLADDVTFMFISVDPARDTPDLLERYVSRFDPTFIGLSGDEDGLNAIAEDFSLFWDIREGTGTGASGYLVDHTASRYLLNPAGELIRIYSFTTTPQVIEQDIRDLLAPGETG